MGGREAVVQLLIEAVCSEIVLLYRKKDYPHRGPIPSLICFSIAFFFFFFTHLGKSLIFLPSPWLLRVTSVIPCFVTAAFVFALNEGGG